MVPGCLLSGTGVSTTRVLTTSSLSLLTFKLRPLSVGPRGFSDRGPDALLRFLLHGSLRVATPSGVPDRDGWSVGPTLPFLCTSGYVHYPTSLPGTCIVPSDPRCPFPARPSWTRYRRRLGPCHSTGSHGSPLSPLYHTFLSAPGFSFSPSGDTHVPRKVPFAPPRPSYPWGRVCRDDLGVTPLR